MQPIAKRVQMAHPRITVKTVTILVLLAIGIMLIAFWPVIGRLLRWNSNAPHVVSMYKRESELELSLSCVQPPFFADMHIDVPPTEIWLVRTQRRLPAMLLMFGMPTLRDCWGMKFLNRAELKQILLECDATVLLEDSIKLEITNPPINGVIKHNISIPVGDYTKHEHLYVFTILRDEPTGVSLIPISE